MDESDRPRPGPGPVPAEGTAPDPRPVGRHAAPEPGADPAADRSMLLPPVPAPPVPAPPVPAPPPRRHTRRWFLGGVLAVLAGGGAGVGAAFLRHRTPHRPPEPPSDLVAAAAAERALIADLVATTGGDPGVRVVIAQAIADHRAHLAALEGLLGQYRRPVAPPRPVRGRPRTKAQLRAAESAAASTGADRALGVAGREAALLASIAACEAGHAELFR